MDFVICKFKKSFQGGINRELVLVEKTDGYYIQEALERWGENSDGGHNYGYTVTCEKIIEHPTQIIVDRFIKKYESNIELYKRLIKINKEKIEYLQSLKLRKLPQGPREIYESLKKGKRIFIRRENDSYKYVYLDGTLLDTKNVEYLIENLYIRFYFSHREDTVAVSEAQII